MLKINSYSGSYTIVEPIDFGILNEYEMKEKWFIVHHIPKAEKLLIKIIPKKDYPIFIKIKTKEFTTQIGKDLEKFFKKLNVLYSSGIFIISGEYICELILALKNIKKLSEIKEELTSINGINFEIIELNLTEI